MDDEGGKDWQARELNGKTFPLNFIDSMGQIHLEEAGLALIPGIDSFVPVQNEEKRAATPFFFLFQQFNKKDLFVIC